MIFLPRLVIATIVWATLLLSLGSGHGTSLSTMGIAMLFLSIVSSVAVGFHGGVWPIAVSLLLSLSAPSLLFLVDTGTARIALSLIAVVVHHMAMVAGVRLLHTQRDRTAEGLIAAASHGAFFLFVAGSYGFYLNFFVPTWMLIVSWAAGAFCASFPLFMVTTRDSVQRMAHARKGAFLIALCIAQAGWVASLWPFGYLTTSVLVLLLFAFLWELSRSAWEGSVTRRWVGMRLVLFAACAVSILLTSRWIPGA